MRKPVQWGDAAKIRGALAADGWLSPDTYSKHFAPIISGAGVYLFLLTDTEAFDRAIVAYVGMSVRLSQRLSAHPVLRELQTPGYWTQRMFKPVPRGLVRETERQYIASFDPPWNVQGRVRGVEL